VHDWARDCYWINIQDPAIVQGLFASDLTAVAALSPGAKGPHGLALDCEHDQLLVAYDAAQLVVIALASGTVVTVTPLAGPPDVIWRNELRGLLYVGIGDPGCVQVVDTVSYRVIDEISTEPGAHTLAFDTIRQRLYVFLPKTGRVAVYRHASEAKGYWT
jgi:DNA-binding beta-propeller fold protein YncE